MNRRKLLRKLIQGSLNNVRFADFTNLVRGFGFACQRLEGSHQVFVLPAVKEIVSLQEVRGEAKPYQIRQFLKLVERYNLQVLEEDHDA